MENYNVSSENNVETTATTISWSAGAIVWFVLVIIGQWIMFIEYITKPITAYNSAYQHAALAYGIAGAIGTALYLWLLIGKSKAALVIILILSAINIIVNLASGGGAGSFLGIVSPVITFLISRKRVGF